jgi:hypothetical protein
MFCGRRAANSAINKRFIPGAVETDPSAAEERFFLKKEAKTFASWCARCGSAILL